MRIFERNCPKCNNIIKYKTIKILNSAIKNNYRCIKCRNYREPLKDTFTSEQEEMLIALMLGDGCVQFSQKKAKYPRLTINRKLGDKKYLEYQREIFANFCKMNVTDHSISDKRTNKTYHGCHLITRSAPAFLETRNRWYPKGQKIIPKDLKLTDNIILFWFLDDGCLVYDKFYNKMSLKLSTHGFKKSEVNFLISLLEKRFNEKFYLCQDNEKYYIVASNKAAANFIKDFVHLIPPFMSRKLDGYNNFLKQIEAQKVKE